MAGSEAEEEREFLAELKARSGRDLAEWMQAITAQGFADKNEAIDWLRAQGFPFARASWLERIHSNGGRPIYLQGPPPPASPDASGQQRPPLRVVRPAPSESPPAPVPPATTAQSPDDQRKLESLIAAAKGYRPLYQLLEGEIRRILPAARITPKGGCISIGAPAEFAAVGLTAAEIRLGLDLGERPHDSVLLPVRIKGAGPGISHMLVLKDARQVNAELLALIATACARVNGPSAE